MYTKSFYKRGEMSDGVLIAIAIVLALVALGVFKRPTFNTNVSKSETETKNTSNNQTVVNPTTKCGLQIVSPEQNERIGESIVVSGYANGCGWEHRSGYVGYVHILDGTGTIVSNLEPLDPQSNTGTLPISFEETLYLTKTPKGNAGLMVFYSMPGDNGAYVSEKMPILFK